MSDRGESRTSLTARAECRSDSKLSGAQPRKGQTEQSAPDTHNGWHGNEDNAYGNEGDLGFINHFSLLEGRLNGGGHLLLSEGSP